MNKKFTKLIAAIALLAFMTPTTGWATDVVDQLNKGDFAATSTSYTNFSDVQKHTAVYAGRTSVQNNSVGMKRDGTNGAGIFTTVSGGVAKSLSFTWTSTSDRTLQVWGKNSAYSLADTKNQNNFGTKIAEVTYNSGNTNPTLTLNSTTNYEYILIIPSSTSMLSIKDIEITWEVSGGGDTPTITIGTPPATIAVDNENHSSYFSGDLTPLTVSYENLTISSQDDFSVKFYDGSGDNANELTGEDLPDWVSASVYTRDEAYKLGVTILANSNHDARTPAYLKVCSGTTLSNVVTITQQGAPCAVYFIVGNSSTFVPNADFEDDAVEVPAGTYHLPSATDDGFVFIGWNDGTNTYAAGAEYTINDDVTFTAQWKFDSDLTITNSSTALSFDLYNNSTAQTIAYTTSSTGNITIEPSTSDYFTIEHNGNNITITPTAVTPSTQTVTINQAADDDYVAGFVSFTVDITDSTPFAGVIVTFDATVDVSNSSSIVKSPVTFSCTNCKLDDGAAYRIYTNSETTISTSEGKITQIEFTQSGNYLITNLSTETGNYDHGVWTGYANSVVFSASAQVRVSQIVVTVSPESSVAFPTFTVNPGTYTESKSVEINCATSGSTIYYTTDGTTPNNTSTVYSGAITVDETMALKAIAYVGDESSYVATANYYIVYETASMPFAFDGNANDIASTSGLTQSGLESYGSSPALQFNTTGDNLVLRLDNAPVSLSYDIKGGSFSGGTFKVLASSTGSNYDVELATYTELSNSVQSITHLNLDESIRYIKWIYTYKKASGGNVAIGNIHATTQYDIYGIASVETFTPTSEKKCTIYNKGKLTVTGTLDNGTSSNLIIEDGGQLITNNAVNATVKKTVSAHSAAGEPVTGWKFIASPIVATEGIAPTSVANMTDADFDLYRFNQEADLEWENYKTEGTHHHFNLFNGQGYLYANASNKNLEFAGAINPSNTPISVVIDSIEGKEFAGWNLVGNPFTFNAVVSMPYYMMNDEGSAILATEPTTGTIAPCTGIMVKATETSQNVVFSKPTQSAPSNGNVSIAVVQANERGASATTVDKAIVSFNEGSELPKFYFGNPNANLYIPQGNKEYAIATSEAQGELPLNFRANADGQYTLTINPEGVEMNYLHLIDNMTGNDIDLLQTPSYSFNAKTTDYESRFRLVFAANNESDVSASSTTFAFYSNGNWMVNNEGEATLQVIDVMGRVLSNQTISGTAELNLNQVPGVYVLRLVNGNDVKTQKIVVK